MNRFDVAGRLVAGVLGIVLIGIGSGLTWWATVAGRHVSGVGVGGIFGVGVLLTLAGLLGRSPSSLALGKDGVTLQLVADAVKDVKASAQQGATAVAADRAVVNAVRQAETETDAEMVTTAIAQRIVESLPATADVTRRALDALGK